MEKIFIPLLIRMGFHHYHHILREIPFQKTKKNYQTVYASRRGSVAAPTAGLHFSKDLLKKLEKKGVKVAYVTLHIGLGTFRSILVEDLTRHHMDSEYYEVPQETADLINEAKAKEKSLDSGDIYCKNS